MLGNTSGFAALVKKQAPNVTMTQCFQHRYALASIFPDLHRGLSLLKD